MSDPEVKKHPIQLKALQVVELYIKVKKPEPESSDYDKEFSFVIGRTDFEEDLGRIFVKAGLEVGLDENSSSPFELRVEVVGEFLVDAARFPTNRVEEWAEFNAPMILYPYVREHAFGLTTRAGIKPILLPLLEVPTFKLG